MAPPSDAPVTLGILLVHGIGEQGRGDTLVHWLDTIVATINRATRATVNATVEWADLARLDAEDESAPHAVVRITGADIDERWIVVEGWWAEAFIAPSFSQLVGWSFRAVPWALAMHAAQKLYQSADEPVRRRRLVRRISAGTQALLLLLLAPFILLLLAVLALLGAIPSGTLRTAIGRFQRALAASAGDSLVFLESPVRAAAMCSAVTAAHETLKRLCDAAGCAQRVVLAHSQGATVSLEALTRVMRRPASDHQPVKAGDDAIAPPVFVTFGAGINKLAALRWLSTHTSLTDAKDDDTVVSRDPVRAACVGLLAMAAGVVWFWRLLATGRLTWIEMVVIPLVWIGASLIVGGLLEIAKYVNKHWGDAFPRFGKAASAFVVAVFIGMIISGVLVANRYDVPMMPFLFVGLLALVLLATLRLTLASDVQERITKSIEAPARIRNWQDFWAAADPVPNGATRTQAVNYPVSTRVWNEGSLLRDHTTYWDNRDGFVLPIVRILASTADSRWRGALPPEYVNVNERARWRVAWLTGARWLVPTAVVLGVLQRGAEMDAVRTGVGEALNAIGIGQWFERIPHAWTSTGLHGGAALLAAWIGYRIMLAVWHAWVSTEQDQLLEHNPPGGLTTGVWVFGGTVMLIVAGAFYVGRTDWMTFTTAWQTFDLSDTALLVAVILLWSLAIVWLIAKVWPPPTALATSNQPQRPDSSPEVRI